MMFVGCLLMATTLLPGCATSRSASKEDVSLPAEAVPPDFDWGESAGSRNVPVQLSREVPEAAEPVGPSGSLERGFFRNVLRDQKAIWTSPIHIRGGDLHWLVPSVAATSALIITDERTASFNSSGDLTRASRGVSEAGTGYATFGLAGGLYLAGRIVRDDRLRETGILGLEALTNASIVGGVLKIATNRERPLDRNRDGGFFKGGDSFPSGHCITVWSLAAVIGHEYSNSRIVPIVAYGLASLVSASRFTGRKHFASDVLVGSALGYFIGRYVYREHHGAPRDAEVPRRVSPLVPLISPQYEPGKRRYGVSLTWNLASR